MFLFISSWATIRRTRQLIISVTWQYTVGVAQAKMPIGDQDNSPGAEDNMVHTLADGILSSGKANSNPFSTTIYSWNLQAADAQLWLELGR